MINSYLNLFVFVIVIAVLLMSAFNTYAHVWFQRQLRGYDGGLSTKIGALELHLEWSLLAACALSRP
jgi:hypothetical protein